MDMYVLAMEVDLHIGHAHSLKDKRGVIRALVDGAHRRYRVSAAEIAHQNLWQRAGLGFAVVASSPTQAEQVMDEVDRFVWSHPEIEVLNVERTWIS